MQSGVNHVDQLGIGNSHDTKAIGVEDILQQLQN